MSTVQMHMGDAHALAATYGQLRDAVRSSVGAMSPLVTEALALLDQPGQNPLNGPIPALSAVGADLLADRRDLEWRIEWLRSTDYISVATTGVSFTFEQDGDLLSVLLAAGLTAEQAEVAEDAVAQGAGLQEAIDTQSELEERERNREHAEAWANFRRLEAQSWSTREPELTPLEEAETALDQIRLILDTAKEDRGDGIGSADADGVWSTNDLQAVIDNEHGYYTPEQVDAARTVLAMVQSSEAARDHLGITQSGGGWSFSDIGHLTLDVFGLVPVVGNAADGINAAWYAAEGDYLNAAISSIALLPGFGQAVIAAKGAVVAALGATAFRSLDEALVAVRELLERWGILGRSVDDTGSTVYRVQGGTPPRASHERIRISPEGNMIVDGEARLYVTFDDLGRAQAYVANNRLGAQIVAFDIDPAFVDRVRANAIGQADAHLFPDVPQIADPTKTDSSFGLPQAWFDDFVDASVPGSGRIVE